MIAQALKQQADVVSTIMLRDLRTRFGKSRLGYAWAVFEPIMHILLLFTIFTIINRGAPYGTSMVLFFATGIIPLFIFTHVSGRVMVSVRAGVALRALPVVKTIDILFARAALELLTSIAVGMALFGGFSLWGIEQAIPHDPLAVVGSVCALTLFAFGVGLLNAIVAAFFRAWQFIYAAFARSLIFISGVFYVVDFMPGPIRAVLVWNPIVHAIEWMREGFYPDYPALSLDLEYFMICTLSTLLVGLSLERALRRRIPMR